MSKAKTAAWVVVHPVHHDGERFGPGDALHVSEEEAAPLLAVGAIIAKPHIHEPHKPERKPENDGGNGQVGGN